MVDIIVEFRMEVSQGLCNAELIHHHHRCSALRQVPGTHSLHSFLPSALLFIFTNEPSIRSFIIPLLGLPCGFFPNILPSNTSLSSPSPLSTCPIQFFFLWYIVLMRHLFSFTTVNSIIDLIRFAQHAHIIMLID